MAKGKTRVEIYRREIADITIRRAFAIISLSLVVIGFAILLISFFDPDLGLMNIAFECFSAFSTVGLSLGITAKLSSASKMVLIAVMFIGRVNMLTLVIAVFSKEKRKNYRYPHGRNYDQLKHSKNEIYLLWVWEILVLHWQKN
ncbi:MAG: potassium transporter TrkG [Flavobacteriaceae bacterium]|nr:potassium transporter TrkG [Flavobacteriaceae bacterium]